MLKYPRGISVWIYIKTMIWSKYNRFYKISSNTYAIYNYAWNKVVFVVPKLEKIIAEHIHSLGFYGGLGDTICASNYCYADYDNSFVINYNGDVFKCTARDFEHNHRVAFLSSEGKIEMLKNTRTSENRFKEACMDCSLLPICTICSQTHIESSSALCPVEISDEDKEQQIFMHFKANFGKYIS